MLFKVLINKSYDEATTLENPVKLSADKSFESSKQELN